MKIYFAAHSTTADNDNQIASGWHDCELSPLGINQSQELGQRFADMAIDIVCGSDLKRSINTINIAFNNRLPVIVDQRLRETNYGDYNGADKKIIEQIKLQHLQIPFPHGESYQQAVNRAQQFYQELIKKYTNQTVLIVGHRATQFGLELLNGGSTLEALVAAKFVWQPYWEYSMTNQELGS